MKNWQRRAIRTFLQTAVGYVCTAIPSVNWSEDKAVLKTTIIGILTSAVAAGIAAAMNWKEEA